MIYLTLNNGTQIEIEEVSTTSAIVVKGNLAKVETAIEEISTETIKNADLNGTTLVNKIYTGFTGEREDDEYTVTLSLRDKTENEIMHEEITELQNALMDIAEI